MLATTQIVSALALFAGIANAKYYRLQTESAGDYFPVWYATENTNASAGNLYLGKVPKELEATATQIKFLDPAANNGRVVFEADPANDKFPDGGFLYINKNAEKDDVWVSNNPDDATSDRITKFDISSGILVPKGESEAHFSIENRFWEYSTVLQYYRDPEGSKKWTTAKLLVVEV